MPAHSKWNQRRSPRKGLARVLSKLGFCSRKQGWELVQAGRARVNGIIRTDPEWPVDMGRDRIEVDGQPVQESKKAYLALNKPRGLVTTSSDEKGRGTVFDCLAGLGLPMVMPVGRLDQASEGLLLFTNDTQWSAQITDPARHLEKTYHVQVDRVADDALCLRLRHGAEAEGDFLKAKRATILRQGTRTSWIEIVLDEGKNRHIRRLLAAFGVNVLRLVRVSIGPLILGALPKGQVRHLTDDEVRGLAGQGRA